MKTIDAKKIKTEHINKNTLNIDKMSALEIVQTMNQEDLNVVVAVSNAKNEIAKAIDMIVKSLNNNGRVIYIGAGTSGRLGVLDAVECPPTFSTTDEFIGLIAGGSSAFLQAVEGAEDSLTDAQVQLEEININKNDIVVGVAASGRTPYVIGGLIFANKIGCQTIAISCSLNGEISTIAKHAIEVDCGPEIITGSTRLKSGTATKIILNMLSTGSLIKVGKTYGNLMVDLTITNEKLFDRAVRIIREITNCERELAVATLKETNNNVKLAIIMISKQVDLNAAKLTLSESNGILKCAIN